MLPICRTETEPLGFLSPLQVQLKRENRGENMVGAASRRTTPAVFSDRPSKKPRGAAPHSTTQRQFERAGLKKQIWAASPSGKRSPPARPQLRKSAHRRAYQRAYQRPGTKKAPRRCWAGVMMTAQWHMVCRAPGATPGKKKSPSGRRLRLFRKATIDGNDCLR